MDQSYEPTNPTRTHDEAFTSWLRTMPVSYGRGGTDPKGNFLFDREYNGVPIISVWSGPDRAYADVLSTLRNQGWIDQATIDRIVNEKIKVDTRIMPYASITRGDPEPETENVDNTGLMRTNGGDYYPMPRRERTPYTVRFWAAQRFTENHIREWIRSQFGGLGCHHNERMVRVDHPSPFGSANQSLKLTGISDETDLEGDKIVYRRFRADFVFKTFVFLPKVSFWGRSAV